MDSEEFGVCHPRLPLKKTLSTFALLVSTCPDPVVAEGISGADSVSELVPKFRIGAY